MAKPAYPTLDFPFELKSLTDEGLLEGYAAVFGNVDLGGDLIEPGAFTKTIQETGGKVPILWSHDREQPIGVSSTLEQDRKGLLVTGQLNMDVQKGREARSLLQQGAFAGLSIGYKTIKPIYEAGVRHLKELALKEFSPVVFPMNPLALASVKADGTVVWAPDASAEALRDELTEALNPPGTFNYWVRDISRDQDLALVSSWTDDDEDAWVVPFTVDADGDVQVAPSSEWVAAEQAWVAATDTPEKSAIAALRALDVKSSAARGRGITAIRALLDRTEPPPGTPDRDGAAKDELEPALSHFGALFTDIKEGLS
jgi:HK97 family phage prohead protease